MYWVNSKAFNTWYAVDGSRVYRVSTGNKKDETVGELIKTFFTEKTLEPYVDKQKQCKDSTLFRKLIGVRDGKHSRIYSNETNSK